jgi:hypothetical protein
MNAETSRVKVAPSPSWSGTKAPDFTIAIPAVFGFKRGDLVDVDSVLAVFEWNHSYSTISIDFTACRRASYQALALVVLYAWHLRSQGCFVRFKFSPGVATMWNMIGGSDWMRVLDEPRRNFRFSNVKPFFAIRDQRDFEAALEKVESYTHAFNVEYEKTLRYVLSELLYNTLEHGLRTFPKGGKRVRLPSVVQFTWYSKRNELAFIISDLGMGIKKHLEQAYPAFKDHVEAIKRSLEPNVSGTFGVNLPYANKNNAGVGLFLSSNIIKRLDAEMHIVSSDGLVHISPTDVTGRTLAHSWPGTIVLVFVKLGLDSDLNLQKLMSELRKHADGEVSQSLERETAERLYLNVENHFNRYAENKEAAIRYRDCTLIPAIEAGKTVLLDFEHVASSPHSFLSALLATPAHMLGMTAYKRIKIVNASPDIRETIDFIFDKETS